MEWVMLYAIVGNGVTAVTAAQIIRRAHPAAEVHIFGAEPYPYYRRPLLWQFIAGQIEQDALYFRPQEWYTERGIQLHLGAQATSLHPTTHRLNLRHRSGKALAAGSTVKYDRLLLATGSRPFLPPVAGTDKEGVFTLHTLDDALAIKAYAQGTSTAVLIGGGLLGLETAQALRAVGLDVTVVEFAPHLLPRQLDAEGAHVLQLLLQAQGWRVFTGARTEAILGAERAVGVRLQDGRTIPGELVLLATGTRCEVTLAQAAGLRVNHGVVVDSHLRTSAQDVFAAGDVAEFEGQLYGIIPPAIEQARAAAANMVAPGSATYDGTLPVTRLKVTGVELTALGERVGEGDECASVRRVDLEAGRYRKFVLRAGRIVGAILLNDEERVRPVTQLIQQGVDVSAHANRLLDDDFAPESLLPKSH
jgi:nitrite reductase (NADH) large subunit